MSPRKRPKNKKPGLSTAMRSRGGRVRPGKDTTAATATTFIISPPAAAPRRRGRPRKVPTDAIPNDGGGRETGGPVRRGGAGTTSGGRCEINAACHLPLPPDVTHIAEVKWSRKAKSAYAGAGSGEATAAPRAATTGRRIKVAAKRGDRRNCTGDGGGGGRGPGQNHHRHHPSPCRIRWASQEECDSDCSGPSISSSFSVSARSSATAGGEGEGASRRGGRRGGCTNCLIRRRRDHSSSLQVYDTSTAKGLAVRATSPIRKDAFVVEYVGVAVPVSKVPRLQRNYESDRDLYFMRLDERTVLDARHKGGIARYINHGCVPNCRVDMWKVDGLPRACIFAVRDIEKGEELMYDYGWAPRGAGEGREATECLCGADGCRGTLELLPSPRKSRSPSPMRGATGTSTPTREASGVVTSVAAASTRRSQRRHRKPECLLDFVTPTKPRKKRRRNRKKRSGSAGTSEAFSSEDGSCTAEDTVTAVHPMGGVKDSTGGMTTREEEYRRNVTLSRETDEAVGKSEALLRNKRKKRKRRDADGANGNTNGRGNDGHDNNDGSDENDGHGKNRGSVVDGGDNDEQEQQTDQHLSADEAISEADERHRPASNLANTSPTRHRPSGSATAAETPSLSRESPAANSSSARTTRPSARRRASIGATRGRGDDGGGERRRSASLPSRRSSSGTASTQSSSKDAARTGGSSSSSSATPPPPPRERRLLRSNSSGVGAFVTAATGIAAAAGGGGGDGGESDSSYSHEEERPYYKRGRIYRETNQVADALACLKKRKKMERRKKRKASAALPQGASASSLLSAGESSGPAAADYASEIESSNGASRSSSERGGATATGTREIEGTSVVAETNTGNDATERFPDSGADAKDVAAAATDMLPKTGGGAPAATTIEAVPKAASEAVVSTSEAKPGVSECGIPGTVVLNDSTRGETSTRGRSAGSGGRPKDAPPLAAWQNGWQSERSPRFLLPSSKNGNNTSTNALFKSVAGEGASAGPPFSTAGGRMRQPSLSSMSSNRLPALGGATTGGGSAAASPPGNGVGGGEGNSAPGAGGDEAEQLDYFTGSVAEEWKDAELCRLRRERSRIRDEITGIDRDVTLLEPLCSRSSDDGGDAVDGARRGGGRAPPFGGFHYPQTTGWLRCELERKRSERRPLVSLLEFIEGQIRSTESSFVDR